jgi:hypothetical protein
VPGSCECGNVTASSTKWGEILNWLRASVKDIQVGIECK